MPRHRYKGQPIPKPAPKMAMATKQVETVADLADGFADLAKVKGETVTIQLGKPVVRFIAELLAGYVAAVDKEAEEAAPKAEEEKPQ